ncbi:MAG: chromate transporter [Lachnospiraceae bacterium]
MKELATLFISFFRIGILTFGGGMAMLPMLQAEVVDKHRWATEEELLNYYAVGQCTPGIIAVNTATFIGFKEKGIIGGITATLGVICPSMIIITLIAGVLTNFCDIAWVQSAFGGIRVAVCALVLNSIIKLWKAGVKNIFGILMFLLAFLSSGVLGISSVWVVIAAICIGNIYQTLMVKKTHKEGK